RRCLGGSSLVGGFAAASETSLKGFIVVLGCARYAVCRSLGQAKRQSALFGTEARAESCALCNRLDGPPEQEYQQVCTDSLQPPEDQMNAPHTRREFLADVGRGMLVATV